MRIKDKVGIERTETLVFRMRLRVDYPNFAATGTDNPKYIYMQKKDKRMHIML